MKMQNIESNNDGIQQISVTRRILPQILATSAKNLVIFILGEFTVLPGIVISSLNGHSKDLNPDETISATGDQTSWLSSFGHIAHPIGSVLSGPVCEKIGRRKAIMVITIPLIISWIMLGCARSLTIVYIGFILLGLCMGLKESPSLTYVSEISEPKFRGMLSGLSIMSFNFGILIVYGLGAILPWRQVAFVCAAFPIACLVAIYFVPESPKWLLSKNRSADAEKSLQWLRGWVPPQNVHDEFIELKNFSRISNACFDCSKRSIACSHPEPTFCDKFNELKRKRNIKPFILCFFLFYLHQFNLITVWQPYIIQVVASLGTPLNASLVTVINAVLGIFASILLIFTIKKLGRRKIFLISIMIVTICSFAMCIYGYIFLPSGWTSFDEHDTSEYKRIQNNVGGYGTVALAIIFLMNFITRFAIGSIPGIVASEVFPFKSRSFLCGITTALQYGFATIAAKTYYTAEMLLSLPGACFLYGVITFIGFIVVFFIMPETEQRSLEDIEIHYSDNSKAITDIYIHKQTKL